MNPPEPGATLRRRTFLAAAAGATLGASSRTSAAEPPRPDRPICAFVKFLPSLDFDRLAATIAELGFDGIEATVRPKGQIEPERVEDDLPRLVEALKAHGLRLNLLASDINRADQPHAERVLRTARGLGLTQYRMNWYQYDLKRPVAAQVEALRPVARDLAALNREIGITAVYQNHAGAKYLGASVWDIHELLGDIPPAEIGVAFDIRHATVEGGLSWPVRWNLVEPRVGAVFLKDFRWDGRQVEDVPLGRGQVDPAFFKLLGRSPFRGPISLHVEYLEQSGVAENVAAFREDLGTLRRLLRG